MGFLQQGNIPDKLCRHRLGLCDQFAQVMVEPLPAKFKRFVVNIIPDYTATCLKSQTYRPSTYETIEDGISGLRVCLNEDFINGIHARGFMMKVGVN